LFELETRNAKLETDVMTLPTKLTILRILLTFVLMGLLFLPGWIPKAAALAGFLVASATDWADGYLARRWGQTSALGALLDPIADKVLVLGMFLAFVQLRLVPAWMVLVIALREFLITGVRLFAASRNLVLSASKEGKHKTVSQMVAIVTVLSVLVIEEWRGYGGLSPSTAASLHAIILGMLWIAVILTTISGLSFFWRHRTLLMDTVGGKG